MFCNAPSLLRFAPILSIVALHSRNGSVRNFLATASAGGTPSFRPTPAFLRKHHAEVPAKTTTSTTTTNTTQTTRKKYKLLQVQIVHRHGDRTPITPMKNETFWAAALPKPRVLEKIATGTTLVRDESKVNAHSAGGRGPFGQLTTLGLLQMVDLGGKLREELHHDELGNETIHVDDDGNVVVNKGMLFCPRSPLHPRRIKVTSTDFPRTIQSVQGLLVGMFPEGVPDDDVIEIDVRHTSVMIPDPQPRRTKEQEDLEKILASRAHLEEKEEEMKDLAIRTTDALREVLGHDADDVSFGVGEEKAHGEQPESKPLPWSQLSEITKCLQVRDLLPDSISDDDQEAISFHAAWRWFENLRHPRLATLAMNTFISDIVNAMHRGKECPRKGTDKDEPWLHIYSAHDSTLIGLLCAFRLEQPSMWPEYASYLKMELIEAVTTEDDVTETSTFTVATDAKEGETKSNDVKHYVRFSLNGKILRCFWGLGDDGRPEPMEMIPLEHLTAVIHHEHPHMDNATQ